MSKVIKLSLVLILFISCVQVHKDEIIGNYSVDKYILLSKTDTAVWWSGEILSLKQNSRFEFTDNYSKKIRGTWKIEESAWKSDYYDRTEPYGSQAIISFAFDKKIIKADFRSGVFYFDDPNSFRKGKYKSVLYVKTNN